VKNWSHFVTPALAGAAKYESIAEVSAVLYAQEDFKLGEVSVPDQAPKSARIQGRVNSKVVDGKILCLVIRCQADNDGLVRIDCLNPHPQQVRSQSVGSCAGRTAEQGPVGGGVLPGSSGGFARTGPGTPRRSHAVLCLQHHVAKTQAANEEHDSACIDFRAQASACCAWHEGLFAIRGIGFEAAR
jgi:hypothetical protein